MPPRRSCRRESRSAVGGASGGRCGRDGVRGCDPQRVEPDHRVAEVTTEAERLTFGAVVGWTGVSVFPSGSRSPQCVVALGIGRRSGTRWYHADVARTYSSAEVAAEAGCPEQRVRWMTEIGLVTPDDQGGSRTRRARREDGVGAAGGRRAGGIDQPPRPPKGCSRSSARTNTSLRAGRSVEPDVRRVPGRRGTRAELLPAVYEVLGLPTPDPSRRSIVTRRSCSNASSTRGPCPRTTTR
jgi:hypothetical protein